MEAEIGWNLGNYKGGGVTTKPLDTQVGHMEELRLRSLEKQKFSLSNFP